MCFACEMEMSLGEPGEECYKLNVGVPSDSCVEAL